MPEEPHKNIEDALKAYAQQRRDAAGGPLDMPSHTRAVLQREIAQRAAARPPEPLRGFGWLVASWPRLAVGAAMVAVAGLTLFVLSDIGTKSKTPMELAQAEPQGQSLALLDAAGKGADAGRKLDEMLSKDFKPVSLAQSAPAFNATQMAAGGMERSAAEAEAAKMKTVENFGGVKLATRMAPAKTPATIAALADTKTPPLEPTVAPPPPASPMPAAAPALAGLTQSAMPAPAELPPAGAMPAKAAALAAQAASPASKIAPADVAKAERLETTRLITAGVANMVSLSQRLHFAQVVGEGVTGMERDSRLSPPSSPPVMTSFQLEQTGDRVVITDADGSVYEGRIQPADSAQQQVVEQRRVSRAGFAFRRGGQAGQVMTQGGELIWRGQNAGGQRAQSAAAQQSLYFTASGMNRSVNQRVVVNGVLTSPADGELAYGPAAAGGRLAFDSLAPRGSNAPATPSAPPAAARAKAAVNEAGQMVVTKAPATEPGLVVLPPATSSNPVPAMPQASAQIEGTLRVGNAPESDLTAVGVGP